MQIQEFYNKPVTNMNSILVPKFLLCMNVEVPGKPGFQDLKHSLSNKMSQNSRISKFLFSLMANYLS